MTDQKEVLIVSQNSVEGTSPFNYRVYFDFVKVNLHKIFSASQLTKTIIFYVEGLSHINFKQWLLLLLLNSLCFSFIALAYMLCADVNIF